MDIVNVMIVEDQPIQRELTERALAETGRYRVAVSIDNADLADLYVETEAIDLILMDVYTMFGADGLEAAERIKAVKPSVKIIILTSIPESNWIARAKSIGVESFCYKEVSSDIIVSICDRTMEGESIYPIG